MPVPGLVRLRRRVVVEEAAQLDLGPEPAGRLARRRQRALEPLGGAGQRRGGLQLADLRDLGLGLGRQPELLQRETGVQPGEVGNRRIGGARGAERAQRVLVLLLAIAEIADVVAERVEGGIAGERLLEERLRPVVLLERDVGQAELIGDRGVGRRLLPGRLQVLDGLGRLPLAHVRHAGVVERLDVVGLLGQRLTQEVQRPVPLLVLDRQGGLGDVDVGVGQLGHRRRRGRQPGRGRHEDDHDRGGHASNRAHGVALLPSDAPGRCTPQAASLTSTVLRWTPSRRAARLTFHCARSSVRTTYWRSN